MGENLLAATPISCGQGVEYAGSGLATSDRPGARRQDFESRIDALHHKRGCGRLLQAVLTNWVSFEARMARLLIVAVSLRGTERVLGRVAFDSKVR